ncbi:unnamed protein product [Schistocephalus solidus]|uniref:Transposase n=1 Tax=Schistocephalus solidus TaxID=70667 RepID=A0A183SVH8_SCHSO|nr:unnamed protein product [Schistocephalus solidus]
MGTQHCRPGTVVCSDAAIEVAQDNKLIGHRHNHQEGLQFLLEFVPYLVGAGHGGSVDTDDGDKLVSLKRQAEAHQTGQASHDVSPDGKADSGVTKLCLGAAVPTPTSSIWRCSDNRVSMNAAWSTL